MNRAFQKRCIILCLALVSLLSVLSARLVQIQLVDRQRYAESAAKAYHRTEIIPAITGMIVDRNDEPIAKSIPVSSIFVDKNHLMDPKIASYGLAFMEASEAEDWETASAEDRIRRIHSQRGVILQREVPEVIVQKHLAYAISLLARPLGMRRDQLRSDIENNKGKWFAIAKDIPDDIAERIRDTVEDHYLQGFEFENSLKRWYTNPDLATHLTGFRGEITEKTPDGKTVTRTVGRFGIESALNEFLEGRDGRRQHHRDSRGLVVPGKENSLLPPRAGLNAKLTIDIGIQSIVAEELERGLAEFKAEKGAVIVMDPQTGEVLAMASRPHFNLNDKKDLAENSYNYAIQSKYEPGSTIKIIAAAGAIDQRLVSLDTVINCPTLLQENKFTVRDSHSGGMLPVWKVLQKSNNVGCWKLAKQLGVSRFYDYVHGFGFGEKSGIQLSGENSGSAAVPKLPVDFSRASYGYFIGVTPIQMATAYSVIAGDGSLLKPHIVKALIANDGTVVEEYPREVRRKAIAESTAKKLRGALHKVTLEGGTATRAQVPGHKVAGKTGTALKYDEVNGGYFDGRRGKPEKYVVSFAGFMPADEPRFVCYVVIDDPQTTKESHYGGTIAAPIFSRIAARLAPYMNIEPTEPIEDPIAHN